MTGDSVKPEATSTRVVRGALRVVAYGLLASLVMAAWHDTSKAWDVWYYHLPFAARIAGIIDSGAYTFGHGNQARFDGFRCSVKRCRVSCGA